MAIRRLTGESVGALTYDQAGFDIFTKDNSNVGGRDHIIVYPGVGVDGSNIFYAGNTDANAHWIGIHCVPSPDIEVTPIQAVSLVGDNLTKDTSATFDYNTARYVDIAGADIIYGRFSSVGLLKSTGVTVYQIRLIRGV